MSGLGRRRIRSHGHAGSNHAVTALLARLNPNVLAVLRADGVVELVGADHVHGNVNRAIEAELTAEGDLAQDSSQSFAGSS